MPNEPVIENDGSLRNLLNKLKSLLGASEPEAAPQEECDMLWGADVHYSDNIPVDKGLAVVLEDGALAAYLAFECDDESDTERSVAVFRM